MSEESQTDASEVPEEEVPEQDQSKQEQGASTGKSQHGQGHHDHGHHSAHMKGLGKMTKKRKRIAYTEAKVGGMLNLSFFVVKLVMAISISSVALAAGAVHSLVDISAAIVILLTFHQASKEPDEDHPHGYGLWEPIATLIIAMLLVSAGVEICMEAAHALLEGEHGESSIPIAMVVLVMAIIKEGMARYAFSLGDEIDSRTLHADAWHHRADALSSLGVVLAILFAETIPYIDGIVAISVGILIIWTGIEFIKETSPMLLGSAPDPDTLARIKRVAGNHPKVTEVTNVHVHDYLSSFYISLHVGTDQNLSLANSQRVAQQVERKLSRMFKAQVTVQTFLCEE